MGNIKGFEIRHYKDGFLLSPTVFASEHAARQFALDNYRSDVLYMIRPAERSAEIRAIADKAIHRTDLYYIVKKNGTPLEKGYLCDSLSQAENVLWNTESDNGDVLTITHNDAILLLVQF